MVCSIRRAPLLLLTTFLLGFLHAVPTHSTITRQHFTHLEACTTLAGDANYPDDRLAPLPCGHTNACFSPDDCQYILASGGIFKAQPWDSLVHAPKARAGQNWLLDCETLLNTPGGAPLADSSSSSSAPTNWLLVYDRLAVERSLVARVLAGTLTDFAYK